MNVFALLLCVYMVVVVVGVGEFALVLLCGFGFTLVWIEVWGCVVSCCVDCWFVLVSIILCVIFVRLLLWFIGRGC